MTIEIDKNGNLHLDGRMVRCPFCAFSEPCGSLCALFTVHKWKKEAAVVTLCHREYFVLAENFEDEREV